MTIRLNPYLNFGDRSREALDFYHSVFGGDLQVMTFGESGMSDDPAQASKVMHGMLETPDGLVLMASDTPPGADDPVTGTAINVSVNGDDERIRTLWDGLTEGAEVVVPLSPAPWGDEFGLLNDRFGVAWLFNLSPAGS